MRRHCYLSILILIVVAVTTAFLATKPGDSRVAEAEAALRVTPGDINSISVLAEAAFARRDWDRVADLIEPVLDRADIRLLSLLADAYAEQGGTAIVINLYHHIEKLAAADPQRFRGQWAQFRVDHGLPLH